MICSSWIANCRWPNFHTSPIKQPIQSSVFSRRLLDVPRWDHKTLKSYEKSLLCWKRVVNKRVDTKKICLTMASMDVFIEGEVRFREKDMFLLWPGDVSRFPKSIRARCPRVILHKTSIWNHDDDAQLNYDRKNLPDWNKSRATSRVGFIRRTKSLPGILSSSDSKIICRTAKHRELKHRFALEDWRVSNVHERYFFPTPTWVKCSAFMMDNLQSLALSHTRASYCHRRDRICKWLSCKKHHSRRWRNRAGKYISPRKNLVVLLINYANASAGLL